MERYKPTIQRTTFLPLLSSTDEIEVYVKRGLLEANNIDVTVMAEGVGPITGERDSIYSKHTIFVFEGDFSTAKSILQQYVEYQEIGGTKVVTRVQWKHKIILRILLLITSIFFSVIAFFAMLAHEGAMAYVSGGASFFFLVVLFFSFDRSA